MTLSINPELLVDYGRFGSRRAHAVPRVGSRATDALVEELTTAGHNIVCPKPYPSTPLPPHILEVAGKAVREMTNPPSRGLPEFRDAVASTLSAELAIDIDPRTQVLATSGGMHALFVIFSTLLNEGDSVVVPSPSYFLEGLIEPFGASILEVPMLEKDKYAWNFDLLEESLTQQTKLIFLNTPVNPTGYVLAVEDLEKITELADKHDLLIIADESYDKLVYDELFHRSIISIPEARKRTILVRSFTKSYAMPNWRVGYIVAPSELTESFTKTLEWITLYGNYVSQKTATAALVGPQDWLNDARIEFETNRNQVLTGICRIPGISCVTPSGGPFIFPNFERVEEGSASVADVLLRKFGISSVPGSAFGADDHHVRIALGGDQPLIRKLLSRLSLAAAEICSSSSS